MKTLLAIASLLMLAACGATVTTVPEAGSDPHPSSLMKSPCACTEIPLDGDGITQGGQSAFGHPSGLPSGD